MDVASGRILSMNRAIYLESEFWALVGFSALLPSAVFVYLIRKRRISRAAVSVIGALLVLASGVDFILLQRLAAKARLTSSLWDDALFTSEYSLALYLLPLIMAGMGINLMSHILHEHVIIAELEYERGKGQGRGKIDRQPEPDGRGGGPA
jgi:hypothetical protein